MLYQQGYDAALDDDLLSILEDIGPRSADLSTRAAALRALGRSDAPARRAAAIDALRNDPDPSIRSAAAAALSQKTNEPDVSAALASALESETDAQVREVIELYLQRR
jgi:HEAT repeat protein